MNKNELQEALEKVKPGLASKELIEQSTSFALMGHRVVTYNDEISISHPVEGLNIEGAVKAQALYEFLNKIKKDEIDIEWEDKQIVIESGRTKAGLVFEQEVRLPVEQVGEISDWYKLPEDTIEALKFCYPCASPDMSRPILTCVNVSGSTVEASDSYQIVRYQLGEGVLVGKFLIPANSVKELIRYDVKEIAEGQGWIHFKTDDGTVFSSRILTDEFPDISQYLEFDSVEFDFPKKTAQILERAQVFSRSDFSTGDISVITVEMKENQVRITAENEHGWFEETARTKYDGKPIKFTMGVQFLINLFSRLQTCVIGEDRVKFTGDNWMHVIAMVEK